MVEHGENGSRAAEEIGATSTGSGDDEEEAETISPLLMTSSSTPPWSRSGNIEGSTTSPSTVASARTSPGHHVLFG